jgi:hypothetical protein
VLNLQRVFYKSVFSDSYHGALAVTEGQRQHLTEAKNKIRDHLRAGIDAASISVLGQEKRISPRFRTQGSWSYNLCIQPAQMPPQEIDWDLGVYLPVSVWEDHQPALAAGAYFKLVEGLLRSLCNKEKWHLETKDTCVRVNVGKGCHVDVPLYAAPDKQFAEIQERVLAKVMDARHDQFAEARAQGELPDQDWDSLKEIVLATRDGYWKPSDPGVVSDWYRHQIAEHGEQLRRLGRYLKGWRDFQWTEGGPSSVSLMICCSQSFQAVHGRDDLALLEVARHLGSHLSGDIKEELINPREQFNNLSAEERSRALGKATALSRALSNALCAPYWQRADALRVLREQFGPRLPFEPNWVTEDTPREVVKATAPAIVAQPVIKPTKAG